MLAIPISDDAPRTRPPVATVGLIAACSLVFLWQIGLPHGRAVEAGLGFFRYLLLYLGCGVIAGLTQAYLDPTDQVPMIGASGAIAGVLGAYLVLNPRGNVVVLIWIFIFVRLIRLPAVLMLGLWFLLQLASALSAPPSEPGVAFWAHVGGFVAGLCLVVILKPPGTRLFGPRRTRSFSVAGRRDWGGPWG